MRNFEIRPNLKTAGGEAADLLLGGRFVGSLTMVYRENDRLTGALQLDKESLKSKEKERAAAFAENYIRLLADAVGAEAFDLFVTASRYDRVISSFDEDAAYEDEFADEGAEEDVFEPDETGIDAGFELDIVSEKQSRMRAELKDEEGSVIAHCDLRTELPDVTGQVNWRLEPDDFELEAATELIVSEFDEQLVDTFAIQHRYNGELIETVELTHDDLLETPMIMIGDEPDEYDVVLVRDDGSILTYEIYDASGGLPVGTATVDIQSRKLTGYIDFRSREQVKDAGTIAARLMKELDKEKDYDGLHLSLMHKNELIDDLVFDNETVH
ncbi:hypothetical protein [Paenibacillus humicola]|uniref:hypothetical protein n=1 Tax=Paenibacillus humicola TaxID=3110540 RepID=UPI00237B3048|nr:hypothetical protein [Paenibacillus humicola]